MSTVLDRPLRRNKSGNVQEGADHSATGAAPAADVAVGAPPSAETQVAQAAVESKAGRVARKGWRVPVKRGLLAAVLVGVLAGGGAYGWDYWRWAVVHESTDDAFIDGRISQVSPRVAGHVMKVYVSDNQEVKAGDVLVELDSLQYKAELDQAKGKLAATEADLVSVRSQVEEARAKVAAAEAGVAQSQSDEASKRARNEQAISNLKQYTQAKASGVVSTLEWTRIETESRTAAAELEAATKAVSAAEAQAAQARATLASQESKVGVAQAQIETAKAAVEGAALNLSYTRVIAAEDGRVTKKNVEQGNYVIPGVPMMALVSPEVWVTANFKETQLAHMKAGQKVEIEVDSYPGVKFSGHVDSVQQGAGARFSLLPPENATGNFVKVVQRVPVKIVFDGPRDGGHLLGPGMSAVPAVRVGE